MQNVFLIFHCVIKLLEIVTIANQNYLIVYFSAILNILTQIVQYYNLQARSQEFQRLSKKKVYFNKLIKTSVT